VSLGWLRKIAGGRRPVSPVTRVVTAKPWLAEERVRGPAPIASLRAGTVVARHPSLLRRIASVRLAPRWGGWVPPWLKRAGRVGPAVPAADAPLVAGQSPTPEVAERGLDLLLLLAVLGLLSIGSTIIYSATASGLPGAGGDSFLSRQLVYLAAGGVAMWQAVSLDYRRLRGVTYPLLVLALLLLFAALLFGARNGAHRWIGIGSLTFQPVELAKLALITYVAQSLARKADRVKTFTVGFVPHLVVCGAMMALLLKQPDLGSSVVLGTTTLAMLFVAGARISYIVLALLAAAPMAYQLVVGTPWRLQRVLAYFNPEAFAQGEAYQFLQARLAIGSGGFGGVGLGRGHQTMGYLPEAHNDFIAAPIGEELGFVGIALILGLFGVLLWRGLRAALGARDAFGSYLAFGITFLLGAQALFNLGVVFGVIPNKGITLPLVSYGGTSLIVTMFLVGLLLNVGRRPHWKSAPRSLVNATRKKRQRVRIVVAS
jgi:cell division protein FtsW